MRSSLLPTSVLCAFGRGSAAEYVDRILRGAKPCDLPVEQPTKFDLVPNLTWAQYPGKLLALADELLEQVAILLHLLTAAFGTKRTSRA
jgi:hypothetical protein